jgi:hypothetical protein
MTSPDELLSKLRELPAPEPLDDLDAERVRRRARAVLAEERRIAERPMLAPLRRAWSHAIMPTLVAGAVGTYLYLSLSLAASLYH